MTVGLFIISLYVYVGTCILYNIIISLPILDIDLIMLYTFIVLWCCNNNNNNNNIINNNNNNNNNEVYFDSSFEYRVKILSIELKFRVSSIEFSQLDTRFFQLDTRSLNSILDAKNCSTNVNSKFNNVF
jgi:hypothetical protein